MSEEEEEAEERRQAEIDFVSAAYPDEDEAWIEQGNSTGTKCATSTQIHRRLQLTSPSTDDDGGIVGASIDVILSISMPEGYPVEQDAVLLVNARISNDASASSCTNLRKLVINILPSLINSCRSTAQEHAGSEAVFAVLGRADEWVSTDWANVCESSPIVAETVSKDTYRPTSCTDSGLVLGRRLIHSHHIIAPTKRKAIVELAQHYNLGGFSKIGWPGVVIIEGEENDCIAYVDDIRGMRWQHLVVRGEQHVAVGNRLELEEARALPAKMHEVGDKMSIIAEHCKRAGLEELFLTSMKIYKKNCNDDNGDSVSGETDEVLDGPVSPSIFRRYGALCHVDHMNNGKNYRKWLRKAAAAAGCTLMLKEFDANGNAKRPLIIVAIIGEEGDVKRVLKRWRTSRVDIDAKGTPCLERMMDVLVEGNLDQQEHYDDVGDDVLSHIDCLDEEGKLRVSEECLSGLLRTIGSSKWCDEVQSLISNSR
mmetsp:Transcript_28707/g.63791  ORF Transcript_28707/g.63791 Transcript_28707/m.63791 type:complete len:482 (+) Transcript_28707:76-1521(+)